MGVLEFILQENPLLDSTYSWFIAICGCLYIVFTMNYFLASGIILVLIQERYGVNKQTASYPMNTFVTFSFVLSFLGGPIHYRLKTRKTLILGSVLGMIGSCLSVLSPLDDPITWLSICMAIRGIGNSMTQPPIYQAIATHFQKHLAKGFLILSASISLGGLILPSIVWASAETYGLETSWLIHGSLYCQTILLAMIIRPRRDMQRQIKKDQEPITEQELKTFIEGEQSDVLDINKEKTTKVEDSLKTILFNLLRDKKFYALCVFHNIALTTNIGFRTTIVDYGIDINLEPNLNKYILEFLALGDLARIPTVMLLDSKLCYVETLICLTHTFMAVSIFLLTLTSDALYVIVACVYATFFAVAGASLGPALATLGTSRIAVSLGFATGTLGLIQLCLPYLIGLSRDIYGSYKYFYYLFAVLNFFAALLFAWTRKDNWFKHGK